MLLFFSRQLGVHRSVGHLSMTKEQIALEALQGNHSGAKEDGLAFFPSASLPQELRGHSLLGQVPAASLTLLKLPAKWSAKLSGPSDCPWSVNSARTYARRVGVGPTQYFKVMLTKVHSDGPGRWVKKPCHKHYHYY